MNTIYTTATNCDNLIGKAITVREVTDSESNVYHNIRMLVARKATLEEFLAQESI